MLFHFTLTRTTPVEAQGAPFLEALLRPATPDSYLEIRPLPDERNRHRSWHRVRDLRNTGFEAVLPFHLDGKSNIYYGVCPRVRQGGTGADVSQATAIWFDEISRPPPDLPGFSWMVETSPGKVQGGYFLKESSRNLDRVERLCQRLRAAVGGDPVWNRDRILRLPGFMNVKHKGAPRSWLVEFEPNLRYGLEDLERVIPALPPGESPQQAHTGTGLFSPHRGEPLPPEDQRRLLELFAKLGLKRRADGRYSGACPFPHAKGACDCDSAFYASPVTGAWWCFCSTHIGPRVGQGGGL